MTDLAHAAKCAVLGKYPLIFAANLTGCAGNEGLQVDHFPFKSHPTP